MGDLNTPLLFCRAEVVVVKRLRGRKKGTMNTVEVTLIFEDRVAKEDLNALNRALREGHQVAINTAKSIIRQKAKLTNMGVPTTRQVADRDMPVYRRFLVDVGEDHFVFNASTITQLDAALK